MVPIAKPALLLSSCLGAASAFAVPFAVEGTLTEIGLTSMTCNGVAITTNADTRYTTPTGTVSISQVLSDAPFPGLPPPPPGKSAFIGGTCIVSGDEGVATSPTGPRPLLAQDVFVEIRENVLVGPTTSQVPFRIMGLEIVLLGTANEPVGRIVASPPVNGFGYAVKLDTVPLGDESSAEGYLGSDGKFYAHVVETSGGDPVSAPASPDTRISRGQVGFVSNTTVKLEVRGSCSWTTPPGATPRTQQVLVVVDNGSTSAGVDYVNPGTRVSLSTNNAPSLSNATCTEDPASPGFGEFRYRLDRYTYTRAVPTEAKARVAHGLANTPPYAWSEPFILVRSGFR